MLRFFSSLRFRFVWLVLLALVPALGLVIYIIVGLPAPIEVAGVNRFSIYDLAVLALVAVLALIAAWIGSEVFLLRKIRAFSEATSRLSDGDLSARTGLVHGADELSQFAHSFDKMVELLEQRDRERSLTAEHYRRWSTQLEQLINGVAEAITKPLEVGSVANIALQRTLSALGLSTGCLFLSRRKDLLLVAHLGISEAEVRRTQRLKAGENTGSLLELLHSEVAQEIPAKALASLPLILGRTGCWTSIPIKTKDRTLGLMCLASPDSRSMEADELKILSAIGRQIGVAIENAQLYEQVQSMAALKERERISRELHDGLAQVLGYLCIRSKATADLVAAGEIARAGAQLEEMQGSIQEAYQDVREAILGLRETVSPERDLISSLQEYAHKFSQQTGIKVNLSHEGPLHTESTPEAEIQLLRIIQESLSNVRKHSEARQAWIKFEEKAGSTIVTIEDNGRGFDPAAVLHDSQPHFGLQTMRERTESVGGKFRLWSQPELGTTIVVTLPCQQVGE
jgi:nitrate/nitrite-specific signal transduction histidine kinase